MFFGVGEKNLTPRGIEPSVFRLPGAALTTELQNLVILTNDFFLIVISFLELPDWPSLNTHSIPGVDVS